MNVLLVLALTVQQPQDTVDLKPVVVTATRVPVAADRVASAVTVLRGSDLVARGIHTVAAALETVPGAHVVQTGSFGGQTSLFVRGGESDYTKVLLDGVALNQAGGAIDLANLTTDNVDRIEIVRGPVSVLYGTDAVTGVIQIFTRSGQGPARFGADVAAGTYGSTRGAVDIAGGTQTIGYSARVSRFSSDGLYPYNNQYRNSVVSAGVRVAPDARTDASLTYRYGDDIYHFPTDGFGAPVDSNQRAAERGPLLSLNAHRVLGQHLDARVTAGVKEARLFYNDEPDSPGEDVTYWSRDFVRRATTSALLTWHAAERVAVSGGIELEAERQRGTSQFSSTLSGSGPLDTIAVRRNNNGYFGQAVLTVGAAAVTVGGRLDANSQFGTHATYRAGLVYRIDQFRVRLSGGTGFKEPTFFENFAHGFVTGNPDLKPERSQSWEAGVERGAVTLTYFNQRFRDLIEYDPGPPPGVPNYYNVGDAIADGIEANGGTNVGHHVALSLSYTYLHTRVEKSGSSNPNGLFVPGKPLVRRPAHTVAPQVVVTLGARARVIVGGRWVGKRDDVGAQRVTLPPYTRVNLSGEYTVGSFVLSGSLENAFNDQAQEINGFRPLGRTVLLGVRVALD